MFYLLTKNNRKYLIKLIEKYYFLIVFIASFSILISAYILELFFNHPPCNLCEYQRVPYFLLLLISLVSLKIKKIQLKIVAFICFFSSLIISGFHSLVERKLVEFDIGCTSTGSDIDNIEDLRNFLEQTPLIKCDEISFSILGLSLANLNFVISALLIMISYYTFTNHENKTSRNNR